MARFRNSHIRPVDTWTGSSSSWRVAVASLSHHLLCRYQVPAFMTSVWYALDVSGDAKRSWVVDHGQGQSFRSLALPLRMTRAMEHIFLASQDHLTLEVAMRRAELLALGMPLEFTAAILSTRIALEFHNSDFWRMVWLFLITHATELDPTQIGPIIDYIQAVRHDRVPVETENGMMELPPPQPRFSIKGRTVASMLRCVQQWHRELGISTRTANFSWTRATFNPWLFEEIRNNQEETPRQWQMVELLNSAQLREEGSALHHCVGSYAYRCHAGLSSIWSLRAWHGEQKRPILTIEVDPKKRVVVQARGYANHSPSGKPLSLLKTWANREGLVMTI